MKKKKLPVSISFEQSFEFVSLREKNGDSVVNDEGNGDSCCKRFCLKILFGEGVREGCQGYQRTSQASSTHYTPYIRQG